MSTRKVTANGCFLVLCHQTNRLQKSGFSFSEVISLLEENKSYDEQNDSQKGKFRIENGQQGMQRADDTLILFYGQSLVDS